MIKAILRGFAIGMLLVTVIIPIALLWGKHVIRPMLRWVGL